MQSFHINDLVALFEELIAEEVGLIKISSRVFAQVEEQMCHTLSLETCRSGYEFGIGSACEFGQTDVTRAFVQHKCRIHAMDRNLVPGDIERYLLPGSLHGDRDLRAGRPLHKPYHRILRSLMSGYLTGIHQDYAVSLLKPGLFGRSSGNDAEHDGRVVGHIELYAYSLEIA